MNRLEAEMYFEKLWGALKLPHIVTPPDCQARLDLILGAHPFIAEAYIEASGVFFDTYRRISVEVLAEDETNAELERRLKCTEAYYIYKLTESNIKLLTDFKISLHSKLKNWMQELNDSNGGPDGKPKGKNKY